MIVLASALLLCYPQNTRLICWPRAPEVDIQALHNPDRLPRLLPLSSHPPHPSNIKLIGVLDTYQRESCLDVFLILFPLPRPPWYRNHLFCPSSSLDNSYSALCPSPGVSSSPTWLDALWLCFHGNLHTYILCHWQSFVQFSLPHQLISNLIPETKSYLCLIPRPSVGVIKKESLILAAEPTGL